MDALERLVVLRELRRQPAAERKEVFGWQFSLAEVDDIDVLVVDFSVAAVVFFLNNQQSNICFT